jgi:hypothetical protein
MSWLRVQWKWVLAVMVVAAVGIQAFFADHNNLQTASDADAFRRVLGDDAGRALAAAGSDVVFAAAYGVLGVIAFQAHAKGWLATVGCVLVAGGALFDELENVVLIRSIAAHRTIGDSAIDLMQIPGTLKWIGAPGVLLLFGVLVARALHR